MATGRQVTVFFPLFGLNGSTLSSAIAGISVTMLFPAGHPYKSEVTAFLALWQSKASDGLPRRSDFSMAELRPYMGRVAILDVVDGGRDFRYRLYGSDIAEEYQADMSRKSVNEFRPHFRAAIVPGYQRCLATRAPHYDVIDIDDEMMRYKWERIVLPLATDGRIVDMIMVYRTDLIYERRN